MTGLTVLKHGKLFERCMLVFSNVLQEVLFVLGSNLDWLQSLKQFFINVSYHILAASLTLMALF